MRSVRRAKEDNEKTEQEEEELLNSTVTRRVDTHSYTIQFNSNYKSGRILFRLAGKRLHPIHFGSYRYPERRETVDNSMIV